MFLLQTVSYRTLKFLSSVHSVTEAPFQIVELLAPLFVICRLMRMGALLVCSWLKQKWARISVAVLVDIVHQKSGLSGNTLNKPSDLDGITPMCQCAFFTAAILAPTRGINTGVTNDPNLSSVQFRSGTVQTAVLCMEAGSGLMHYMWQNSSH